METPGRGVDFPPPSLPRSGRDVVRQRGALGAVRSAAPLGRATRRGAERPGVKGVMRPRARSARPGAERPVGSSPFGRESAERSAGARSGPARPAGRGAERTAPQAAGRQRHGPVTPENSGPSGPAGGRQACRARAVRLPPPLPPCPSLRLDLPCCALPPRCALTSPAAPRSSLAAPRRHQSPGETSRGPVGGLWAVRGAVRP